MTTNKIIIVCLMAIICSLILTSHSVSAQGAFLDRLRRGGGSNTNTNSNNNTPPAQPAQPATTTLPRSGTLLGRTNATSTAIDEPTSNLGIAPQHIVTNATAVTTEIEKQRLEARQAGANRLTPSGVSLPIIIGLNDVAPNEYPGEIEWFEPINPNNNVLVEEGEKLIVPPSTEPKMIIPLTSNKPKPQQMINLLEKKSPKDGKSCFYCPPNTPSHLCWIENGTVYRNSLGNAYTQALLVATSPAC